LGEPHSFVRSILLWPIVVACPAFPQQILSFGLLALRHLAVVDLAVVSSSGPLVTPAILSFPLLFQSSLFSVRGLSYGEDTIDAYHLSPFCYRSLFRLFFHSSNHSALFVSLLHI
jgi:hypothetical protein